MEYVIEKNVPVPKGRPGRKPIYPFSTMAVGDSIFIADPDANKAKSSACGTGNKRKGKRFSSRRLTENDQCGVRIWRTE
jgi:hypothetical protein